MWVHMYFKSPAVNCRRMQRKQSPGKFFRCELCFFNSKFWRYKLNNCFFKEKHQNLTEQFLAHRTLICHASYMRFIIPLKPKTAVFCAGEQNLASGVVFTISDIDKCVTLLKWGLTSMSTFSCTSDVKVKHEHIVFWCPEYDHLDQHSAHPQ